MPELTLIPLREGEFMMPAALASTSLSLAEIGLIFCLTAMAECPAFGEPVALRKEGQFPRQHPGNPGRYGRCLEDVEPISEFMPTLDLTNAEACILKWVRAELLRLEGSNNGECGVLVLGNPDQADAIIREMDHSLDGFSPIPDGETLISNGRIHAFATLVE